MVYNWIKSSKIFKSIKIHMWLHNDISYFFVLCNSFESGRRCPTGPGIYAFRCSRAQNLFNLLQSRVRNPFIDDRSFPAEQSPPPDPGPREQMRIDPNRGKYLMNRYVLCSGRIISMYFIQIAYLSLLMLFFVTQFYSSTLFPRLLQEAI